MHRPNSSIKPSPPRTRLMGAPFQSVDNCVAVASSRSFDIPNFTNLEPTVQINDDIG